MPLLRNWRKKLVTKSDDKRVPVLRFKGFTDEWEQRKLGEVANIFDVLIKLLNIPMQELSLLV